MSPLGDRGIGSGLPEHRYTPDNQISYTGGMDERYSRNDRAVFALGYHLVWCPKYRKRVLVGPVETRLKELITQRCAEREWEIVTLDVMPDHIHLFVRTDPTDAPAFIVNQLKGATSLALRKEFGHLRSTLPTLWSRSYFITSVGQVSAVAIQHYIESQKTVPPKYGKRKTASL